MNIKPKTLRFAVKGKGIIYSWGKECETTEEAIEYIKEICQAERITNLQNRVPNFSWSGYKLGEEIKIIIVDDSTIEKLKSGIESTENQEIKEIYNKIIDIIKIKHQ